MELWFDIGQVFDNLWRLAAAFLLALPVALDRERQVRSLGLRTYPLVAMGACAYILAASDAVPIDSASQSRIVQGLMTGIGFLGAGAILQGKESVRGSATAASVWSTAAIGAAVAYDRIEVALALSIANFATLRWMKEVKSAVGDEEPVKDA